MKTENEAEHELVRRGHCPTCGNPWQHAARLEKVIALVHSIDEELGGVTFGAAAEAIADQLEAWPAEAWVQLAFKANVISPSNTTVNEVIKVYRDRSLTGRGRGGGGGARSRALKGGK